MYASVFTIRVAVVCKPSAVHVAVSDDPPTRPCMLSQLQLLQQLQGPQVLDYLPLLLVKDKMSLNHQMNKLYLSTAKNSDPKKIVQRELCSM